MLVLSRHQYETINIGDDITISVLAIQGNKVRIGIKAPEDVSVMRGELKFSDKHKNSEQVVDKPT